mmetsp:Transcript_14250/g.27724  ORF Transcript_14250/g.27724 Transcript_14250/m.27724 type:complete len:255 (-) Transcript_14250:734-1498(-)
MVFHLKLVDKLIKAGNKLFEAINVFRLKIPELFNRTEHVDEFLEAAAETHELAKDDGFVKIELFTLRHVGKVRLCFMVLSFDALKEGNAGFHFCYDSFWGLARAPKLSVRRGVWCRVDVFLAANNQLVRDAAEKVCHSDFGAIMARKSMDHFHGVHDRGNGLTDNLGFFHVERLKDFAKVLQETDIVFGFVEVICDGQISFPPALNEKFNALVFHLLRIGGGLLAVGFESASLEHTSHNASLLGFELLRDGDEG